MRVDLQTTFGAFFRKGFVPLCTEWQRMTARVAALGLLSVAGLVFVSSSDGGVPFLRMLEMGGVLALVAAFVLWLDARALWSIGLLCPLLTALSLVVTFALRPGIQVHSAALLGLTALMLWQVLPAAQRGRGVWVFLVASTFLSQPSDVASLLDWLPIYAFWVLLQGREQMQTDSRAKIILGLQRDLAFQTQARADQQRLIGQIAHELRSPLNVILGSVNVYLLVHEVEVESSLEQTLEQVLDAGGKLERTIKAVLDRSMLGDGPLQIRRQAVDVRMLVSREVQAVELLFDERGLKWHLEIAADFPDQVFTDSDRVITAVGNLIRNAQKYTMAGEITIRLWSDPQKWYFSVQDSGVGIAETELTHIFEPFYQAGGQGADRPYQGTGLGLALVRQICEALSGTASVKSTLGAGSLFTLVFPIVPDPHKIQS